MYVQHKTGMTRSSVHSQASLAVAALIISHHYYAHASDTHLSFIEKFVQWDDINNHETWALFFIGVALGSLGM